MTFWPLKPAGNKSNCKKNIKKNYPLGKYSPENIEVPLGLALISDLLRDLGARSRTKNYKTGNSWRKSAEELAFRLFLTQKISLSLKFVKR